jgi:aryl-alcohol dehydrogenase-like predicted oxidoreductase
MRYRQLGASGLRVSVLSMGTMTFGGTGSFASVGSTDLDTARRQIDRCLEAGVNLIDTANVYSTASVELPLHQPRLPRIGRRNPRPCLGGRWRVTHCPRRPV